MRKRADERGMALIFILYLLVTLGVIAAEVARSARAEAAKIAGLRARSIGRFAAESGIVVAMVRIHQVLDSAPTTASQVTALRGIEADLERLGDTALGTARFRVEVVNLNARIDLNQASETMLEEFFLQFTNPLSAKDAVAALKKEPIRRVGELARVSEVDQSLALGVAPYVTVWGDGKVDINAAPESVLVALPGIESSTAEALVRRREAGEVFTSNDPMQPRRDPSSERDEFNVSSTSTLIPEATTTPTRLLLVSRGWQDGHPLTHEIQAAYSILGHRLVLQFWWERDL